MELKGRGEYNTGPWRAEARAVGDSDMGPEV